MAHALLVKKELEHGGIFDAVIRHDVVLVLQLRVGHAVELQPVDILLVVLRLLFECLSDAVKVVINLVDFLSPSDNARGRLLLLQHQHLPLGCRLSIDRLRHWLVEDAGKAAGGAARLGRSLHHIFAVLHLLEQHHGLGLRCVVFHRASFLAVQFKNYYPTHTTNIFFD